MKSTAGTPARRNGVWSSVIAVSTASGKIERGADAAGGGADPRPQRGSDVALARQADAAVAHVVEQEHGRVCAACASA